MTSADLEIDVAAQEILHRFSFDEPAFSYLRREYTAGRAGTEQNRVEGRIEPPRPDDVVALPPPASAERERLDALGREAIATGTVGVVILAGGMATRFGGVVKANVAVLDNKTFLDLKIDDVRQVASRCGGTVPTFLMTSFATDEAISQAAKTLTSEAAPIETFAQGISLRLTPQGDLFRDTNANLSLYAPGHGDLPIFLRRSGALGRFRAGGGRLLYMSNVDNLGATLDPAVIGFHLESGVEITAEVVGKRPGDKGGAPARVDGRLQIVEAFRFPPDFDQDRIDVFNTNSFVLDATALDREFDLTWFAVTKKVDGQPAVQFERLVGQLTAFVPSRYLKVERDGNDGRFQPAKDPDELASRLTQIRDILSARGVL